MKFKNWLIKEETDLENPDIWHVNFSFGIAQHFLGFLHDNHINAINPNDMKFILDVITDNPKLYQPSGGSGNFNKETAERNSEIQSAFRKTKEKIVEIIFNAYKSMTLEQQNQYKELFENKSKSMKTDSIQQGKEDEIKRDLIWKNMINMSDQDFEKFKKLDPIIDMPKKIIMMKKIWQKNANREEWNSLKITHWASSEDAIKLITGQVKPKELSATYYPSNQDMSKTYNNWFSSTGSVAIELKGNVTCGFFMDGQTDNYYNSMGINKNKKDPNAEKFGGRAWTLKPVFTNDGHNELLIQDYKIEKVLIYDPNHHKKETGEEEPKEIRNSYEYVEKLANEHGIPVEHIKTS